jgi:hypothetical protein
MVQGTHGNHAGSDILLFELLQRFRNKTTAYLICGGWEKWGERQDVEYRRGLRSTP